MVQSQSVPKQSRARERGKASTPALTRNWYLLAGVAVVNSLGMAVAVSPLLGSRVSEVWPWAETGFVLLGGLALSVTLLVVHLTLQQRRFTEIKSDVNQMEADAAVRQRQNSERLRAILNISGMIGSVPNKAKLFNHITDTCRDLFHSERAVLMLLDGERNELKVESDSGTRRGEKTGITARKVGEGLSGWVAKTRSALLLSPGVDLSGYPGLDIHSIDVTAAMVVPILLRDELIGILSVKSRVPDVKYNDEDLQALQVFAENVGTAIRHSEHVEWMRRTIENNKTDQSPSTAPFTIEKIPSE